VRVARAFRLPIIAAAAALLLSGCMHASAPVAQSQSDLDAFAYGDPQIADPQVADSHMVPRPVAANATGGAIGALRNALAAAPRNEQPSPAPVAYSAAPVPEPVRYDTGYRLDAGDKLRVVIYGQEGLTNTYAIDAGGAITMPLIGQVPARGRTPATLAVDIAAKLRRGYIREPSVAVEVETYRPFFILGEVAAPGQYSYVPNMTVESAIAIAGGFSPRAKRDTVTLTHTDASGAARYVVPLGTALSPGDTVLVGERWF
jgi:polysaccharide export outer membrane protein